jgi:hypothetical protein
MENSISQLDDIPDDDWTTLTEQQLRFAIFGIASVFVAASFIAASHMPSGKIDPFAAVPVSVFVGVFVVALVLQLSGIVTLAALFTRYVFRNHHFSGFEFPKRKTRVPHKVILIFVVIKLAVVFAIVFILVLLVGAWLSSFVTPIDGLLRTVFVSLVQATVWGAFLQILMSLPVMITRMRDRS